MSNPEARKVEFTFPCPGGYAVSGEFKIGDIGKTTFLCKQYPKSCNVTIIRAGNPIKVGILAFHVDGYCAQQASDIREQIEVNAVAGQTPHSE